MGVDGMHGRDRHWALFGVCSTARGVHCAHGQISDQRMQSKSPERIILAVVLVVWFARIRRAASVWDGYACTLQACSAYEYSRALSSPQPQNLN